MKIDKSFQSITAVSGSDGKRRSEVASTSNIKQENNVHLSSNVTKLQNIDSCSTDGSIVNTAQVQEIKQAISEGNFQMITKPVII